MIRDRSSGHSNAFNKGLGSASPDVSIRMWSGGLRRASNLAIVGAKSSATVQQMQPLVSSTMASSGAIGVGATFKDIAVDADVAELVDQDRKAASLRVLHEVTDQRGFPCAKKAGDDGDGDFLQRHLMFPIRLDGGRDARDHALAEDRWAFAPWHQSIRGRRIAPRRR